MMQTIPNDDQLWLDYNRFISTFLHEPDNMNKVHEMLQERQKRVSFDLNEIRRKNPEFSRHIISDPQKSLSSFQSNLNRMIEQIHATNPDSGNLKVDYSQKNPVDVRNQSQLEYRINFQGDFGQNHISPRGLNCSLVNRMVQVKGIVTQISQARPRWLRSVHYSQHSEKGLVREYQDDNDLTLPSTAKGGYAIPLKDENNHPLKMQFGYCRFKDNQIVIVQELPQSSPTGSLPRSIQVVIEEDLVDKVQPGDRVDVTGVYKGVPTSTTLNSGIFQSVIIATNIQQSANFLESLNPTPGEIKEFKILSKRNDIFDVLSSSVAPSIYGHQNIQKAILLQLFGGSQKTLQNSGHLRGDINVLIIGDPSTAQSQMLRYVMGTAPLALNTTGRGSSGVGLTAAVVRDPTTGYRHLEAGAMVLGDRGIVCIDEFDKMDEGDRVAIHEVMEQQTVTIAKAGIHCSLNARCSVLAAANPVYGQYQREISVSRNVNLPDSLLSRFDLLFLVFDERNSLRDRLIAQRVTRNHRFCKQNKDLMKLGYNSLDEDFVIEPDYTMQDDLEGNFYQSKVGFFSEDQGEILTQSFLQKYIAYAKMNIIDPVMDLDAADYIVQQWEILRNKEIRQSSKNYQGEMAGGISQILPITIRTLQSLIRLSTAHAQMRISKQIEIVDCANALKLLQATLNGFDESDDLDPEDDDMNNDRDGDENPEKTNKQGTILMQKSGQKPESNDTQYTPQGVQIDQRQKNINTRNMQKKSSDQGDMEILDSHDNNQFFNLDDQKKQATKKSIIEKHKQDSKSKEQKDLKYLNRGIKQMKIDDVDDFDSDIDKASKKQDEEKKAMDQIQRNILASFEITFEEQKTIWKLINSKLNEQKYDKVTCQELWRLIQLHQQAAIQNQNVMFKVLEVLHDEEKLVFDKQEKFFYLL